MKKAKLLTMLGAVALIGSIGVGSTLAYLSSTTDEVVNTFTVGEVKITLDESKYDNATGTLNVAERVKSNEYIDMIPGSTYAKDPTVHVSADSEDCYVFVKITGLNSTLSVKKDDAEFDNWTLVDSTKNIYRYKSVVTKDAADKELEVFKNITLDLNYEPQYDKETGKLLDIGTITVEACAVQAANLGETATEAEANALKLAIATAKWN